MVLLLFIPSALYLAATLWLDSHSLMRRKSLFLSLLAGMLAAAAAAGLLMPLQRIGTAADWIDPVVEELLKAVPLVVLVRKRRMAFFADAIIYGTAVGIGFALAENLLYLRLAELEATTMFFRAIATSLMHVGCTALVAICIGEMLRLRSKHGGIVWHSLLYYLVPLGLHEAYNHLDGVDPNIKFLSLLAVLTAIFLSASMRNDRLVQQWLDEAINSDIQLLAAVRAGRFFDTRQGKLLLLQRDSCTPEVFFDMCCYVQVTLELSVISKSRQILKESGFEAEATPDAATAARIKAMMAEHDALRRRISPAALAAMKPIAYLHHSDRWSLQ